MIEGAKMSLRRKEEERKRKGLPRPEEPGLTGEARHFVFKY